jgi:hypothetical protein
MASDLTPEYIAAIRRMSGADKIKAAGALYQSARRIKAAALRQFHPDWTEEQIERKVKEIFLYGTT